ncbi:EamA family transporter [Acetobacter sp. AN02]|uniref:EamA family transporter n=1 Tax=Acetobacter sp. AN02 TaxID=2894186 RepID=UPI00243432C6|nr:EamA family transporter [Acetobacter sp. AN02]MDG6095496.1 EamA family transporter [Acetobacter sp. AN02]
MSVLRHPGYGTGIACGFGAGALWGLVFLVPELARGFTPLQLACGRYFFYGLFSAVLLIPRIPVLRGHVSVREWRELFFLSLAGNTVYFILLAAGVQAGGIAMTSIIVGAVPVPVMFAGSVMSARSPEGEAVPFARLVPFAAGLLPALPGFPLLSAGSGDVVHSAGAWLRFALICAGVAVLASMAGNALWNRASRLLPLTLSGQMILSETLSALIYGCLWNGRFLTLSEGLAFVCVVLSVISCVGAHRRSRPAGT